MRKLLLLFAMASLLLSCNRKTDYQEMADKMIISGLKVKDSYKVDGYTHLIPAEDERKFYEECHDMIMKESLLGIEAYEHPENEEKRKASEDYAKEVDKVRESYHPEQIGWIMGIGFKYKNEYGVECDSTMEIYFNMDKTRCYDDIKYLYKD